MTTHFAFLLLPDFTHLAFSCAVEPLRLANLVAGKPLYRWSLISPDGQSATCSNGSVTLTHGGLEPTRQVDRLFTVSGNNVQSHVTPRILAFLRREKAMGRALGGICTAAYVLARAGLLDGQEAAIHWEFHDMFAEEFPRVTLTRSVFAAGRTVTASGGTAAADMMLHLIGRDHGQALATEIADQMVYTSVRESTASQRVSIQARHGMRNPHLVRAIDMMAASIEEPLPPSEIANRLRISIRQLERLFERHLHVTPKRYSLQLRLHRARNLLVQTDRSITEITMACGFKSASHFSKTFRAFYGHPPVTHRTTLG